MRRRPSSQPQAAAGSQRASGVKTFEQCAGFLRIPDGAEPLDASSVHPEAYGRRSSASSPPAAAICAR